MSSVSNIFNWFVGSAQQSPVQGNRNFEESSLKEKVMKVALAALATVGAFVLLRNTLSIVGRLVVLAIVWLVVSRVSSRGGGDDGAGDVFGGKREGVQIPDEFRNFSQVLKMNPFADDSQRERDIGSGGVWNSVPLNWNFRFDEPHVSVGRKEEPVYCLPVGGSQIPVGRRELHACGGFRCGSSHGSPSHVLVGRR
ncbi:MAG: hypothetical protein HY324_01620 [Chlamydiia bacterium]|nr:hypothetical protein [Chlamydiia bacterium]